MLPAVRRNGDHFVSMMTSLSVFPAAFRPVANDCSDTPAPYISAVSKKLIPPSSAALMMAFFSSWGMTGNMRPISPPPPASSITPSPIGDTIKLVFPRCLNWFVVSITLILSTTCYFYKVMTFMIIHYRWERN